MQWIVLKDDEGDIYSIPLPNLDYVRTLSTGIHIVYLKSGVELSGIIQKTEELKV